METSEEPLLGQSESVHDECSSTLLRDQSTDMRLYVGTVSYVGPISPRNELTDKQTTVPANTLFASTWFALLKTVGIRYYPNYAVDTASIYSEHVYYDNFDEKSLIQLIVDKNTMNASNNVAIKHIDMVPSLLSIPPELLVHILAFLPIRTLLKFSQTSRYAHSLAGSSLHTLSLGIYLSRVSALIARVAATQYPQPKETTSFFSLPHHASPSEQRDISEISYMAEDLLTPNNPYKVSVLIPDAQIFDHTTLLNFHTALTSNVLFRHGATLRHLDLSLWTLTIPIAKALAGLPALRVLSIRIEDFPQVRAVPHTQAATQRTEEREAWSLVTETAIWAPRLNALRIEGGELSTVQLSTLLSKVRWCRELWLCKCAMIDRSLWKFLASEWEGRCAIQILGISRCGGKLDEEVLGWIGGLKSLRFLSLYGCRGVEGDIVEKRNREIWGIKECIPPQRKLRPRLEDDPTIIEVDPAYMDDDE